MPNGEYTEGIANQKGAAVATPSYPLLSWNPRSKLDKAGAL